MRTAFCLMIASTSVVMAVKADTFTGVITDTMCGAKHDMLKDHPADQCVRMCAKGQYSCALYDGTNVLKLSDQKTPAKLAAQRVKVTGTLDPKTNRIKVSSIEPVTEK